MGEQNPSHGELILDIAAESPTEFDGSPSPAAPGFHEQQLLLEMLADPDVAAALDALDAEDAGDGTVAG